MEDKDLDKLFRDAFIEAEETPRKDIWNAIEAELDNQEKVISIKKRNHWWSFAAAAVLLVSIGGYFALHFYSSQQDENKMEEKHLASIDTLQEQTEQPISSQTVESMPIKTIEQKDQSFTNPVILVGQQQNTNKVLAKVNIEQIDASTDNKIALSDTQVISLANNIPLVRQVTEIDDIKPLIEFEEEEETMLASTEVKEKKHIITSFLNTISENIDPKKTKDIRFIADEEGSFSISISNSIAKNPNKKRK